MENWLLFEKKKKIKIKIRFWKTFDAECDLVLLSTHWRNRNCNTRKNADHRIIERSFAVHLPIDLRNETLDSREYFVSSSFQRNQRTSSAMVAQSTVDYAVSIESDGATRIHRAREWPTDSHDLGEKIHFRLPFDRFLIWKRRQTGRKHINAYGTHWLFIHQLNC